MADFAFFIVMSIDILKLERREIIAIKSCLLILQNSVGTELILHYAWTKDKARQISEQIVQLRSAFSPLEDILNKIGVDM